MPLSRSWQFLGDIESPWYRFYDRLRRGVNARLVTFLAGHMCHADRGLLPQRRCVLEAGSGPGFASFLLSKRADVSMSVCMDLDSDALKEARRIDPTRPAIMGDLMRMPFADDSFSLVFNNSTVEHLDDPLGAVREMRRVCNIDGRVFVGVPYRWGPLGMQPLLANTSVGIWLGKVFSRSGLDRLLGAAGLTPIAHMRFFWNVFVGAIASKQTSDQPSTVQPGRP